MTLDMTQRVSAMSEGVNVETLKVEEKNTKNFYRTVLILIAPFYVLSFFAPLFLGYFGIKFSPANIGVVAPYFVLLVAMTGLMNYLYAKMKKQSFSDFIKETKGLKNDSSNTLGSTTDYTTDPIYSAHYGNINHGTMDMKLS